LTGKVAAREGKAPKLGRVHLKVLPGPVTCVFRKDCLLLVGIFEFFFNQERHNRLQRRVPSTLTGYGIDPSDIRIMPQITS